MEPWMRKRRRACRTGSRMTVTVSRVTGGRFISKMKPKQAPPATKACLAEKERRNF